MEHGVTRMGYSKFPPFWTGCDEIPELAVDNGSWSVGDPIRVMGFAPLKSSKGTQLAAFRSRAIPSVSPPGGQNDPAGHAKHEEAESLEYVPALQAITSGVSVGPPRQ